MRGVKRTMLLSAMCLMLLLGGCLPLAIHPFYKQEQLVFDEGLLGQWQRSQEGGGDWNWTFTRAGNDSYSLRTLDDNGRTGVFEAKLFKLGDRQWLDLLLQEHEPELELNDWAAITLAPMHALMVLERQGDKLTLRFIDGDRLKDLPASEPLVHLTKSDNVVFAGTTDQNQQILLKHMKDARFIGEHPGELIRVADPPETPEAPEAPEAKQP